MRLWGDGKLAPETDQANAPANEKGGQLGALSRFIECIAQQ